MTLVSFLVCGIGTKVGFCVLWTFLFGDPRRSSPKKGLRKKKKSNKILKQELFYFNLSSSI